MTIPDKDAVNIKRLIDNIESGIFDIDDVELLLIKLRPYSKEKRVFREIADFVAHPDSRNKGISCQSMTRFADSMRFFVDYIGPKLELNIAGPFPSYIFRLFRSQTLMSNEAELKQRFHLSHRSLLDKIDKNFKVDKSTRMCILRGNKNGKEFIAALQYVSSFIISKPAFDISEFHLEFQQLLTENSIAFEHQKFNSQSDNITLALLCALSGTEFTLPEGEAAKCAISTESHYRILKGKIKKPSGEISNNPTDFGRLQIVGEINISNKGKELTISFPLISSDLTPELHCDSSLFEVISEKNEFGEFQIETINLKNHMLLTKDFKLLNAPT